MAPLRGGGRIFRECGQGKFQATERECPQSTQWGTSLFLILSFFSATRQEELLCHVPPPLYPHPTRDLKARGCPVEKSSKKPYLFISDRPGSFLVATEADGHLHCLLTVVATRVLSQPADHRTRHQSLVTVCEAGC